MPKIKISFFARGIVLRWRQYFKLKNQKKPLSSHLPDPNGPLSQKIPSSGIASANACVSRLPIVDSDTGEGSSTSTPFTRGSYVVLTLAQKFEISKRAAENRAIRYYAKRFPETPFKEMSVRRFKNNSQDELKKSIHSSSDSPTVKELIPKKRRRSLLIGEELDEQVRDYIKELRREGVVINCDVATAVDTGIVMNSDANLLIANSGHIDRTKHWAKYLLSCMGFVKEGQILKQKLQ